MRGHVEQVNLGGIDSLVEDLGAVAVLGKIALGGLQLMRSFQS